MPVSRLAGRAVLSVAFSLIAVLLVVLPAKSDETTPEQDPLPPVTVTATRLPTPISAVGSSVTVNGDTGDHAGSDGKRIRCDRDHIRDNGDHAWNHRSRARGHPAMTHQAFLGAAAVTLDGAMHSGNPPGLPKNIPPMIC